MLPKLAIKHNSDSGRIIPLYPESVSERQERMLIENISAIARKIENRFEDLDNDSRETIEFDLFGVTIYVDVATRGWDYRSIELLAVDIATDNCDALNDAAKMLYNILYESVQRLNNQMDRLYAERDY